jgi:hypothetical protein
MAKREAGGGRPRPQKVKTGELSKAAKAARATLGKGGKAKGADVSAVQLSNYRPPGLADETLFLNWAGKIRKQGAVVDKQSDMLRTERGSYAELFAAAKEAGVPADRLKVLKKTLKEEKRDPGERMAEAREMAFQAKALNSPMVQLSFFDGVMKPPSPAEWELQGDADGFAGIKENPPGKPGSDEHAHYMSGWKAGQKRLAEKTLKGDKPPAPPAGGGFPPQSEPQGKLRVISP